MKQLLLLSILAFASSVAQANSVRVTITNLSPNGGTFLTPVWVGFHNGSFDLYNNGEAASVALERIAEDGDTAPLSSAFGASGFGSVDGTIGGGPIAPGTSLSMTFTLDQFAASSRYFSYASMVVPSNDAFIANGNPLAFQVFSAAGVFLGADFIVLGSMVLDAGTEVNDEIPMNTAFFGQATPNTGVDQNGVVGNHPGFIPGGAILSSAMFSNGNFELPGYQVARIQVEAVPEPATWALIAVALPFVILRARRK